MEKNLIQRKNYRSSLLKKIIIRADFESLTDLDGLVKLLKCSSFVLDNFAGYRIIKSNIINFRMPITVVEDIERHEVEDIHRFSICTIQPQQDVILDVTATFVCLTINCNEKYDCIDGYLDIIKNLIITIQKYDSYVRFTRMAIRKTDGEIFKKLNDGYLVFESNRFKHEEHIDGFDRDTNKYESTECFVIHKPFIKCNLSRSVEACEGEYRFLLDIDAYIDSDVFELKNQLKESEISNILYDMLNETLFIIFKTYVTTAFLNEGIIR